MPPPSLGNSPGRGIVAQGVWGDAFVDAGPTRGLVTRDPDCLIGNRLIESAAKRACGKHVELRLAPAPVLAQGFKQGWTQRQIAILAALACHHADDHPLAVD